MSDKPPFSIPRIRIGLHVAVQIVLVLLLFAVANYLGFNHFNRWDFSRDQKYRLSEQTRGVVANLANLKKPVHAIVFFSGATPVTQDVIRLLKEYAYASKKMINVEVVDPFLAVTRAREVAAQYKLRDNDNVVILDIDGRSKFVTAESMADWEPSMNNVDAPRLKAFKGEAVLTGALLEITEQGVNRIYALTGHGEKQIDADKSLTNLKDYIERQNIQIAPLNLAEAGAIPDDAKALMIIAPKQDFTDAEIKILEHYWTEKRGRFFIALEPEFSTPRLAIFLAGRGLSVNDDRVLRVALARLSGELIRGVWTEVVGDFVEGSPITRPLAGGNVNFVGGKTQSLTLNEVQAQTVGVQLHALIKAAAGFWGETKHETKEYYFDPDEDNADPVIAASAETGWLLDPRLRVESASRLVLIGSSGFLADGQHAASELDFVLNSVNWLLHREEILGIAPKPVRNLALNLTEVQLGSIASLVMVVIPACAALLGLVVWLRRKV